MDLREPVLETRPFLSNPAFQSFLRAAIRTFFLTGISLASAVLVWGVEQILVAFAPGVAAQLGPVFRLLIYGNFIAISTRVLQTLIQDLRNSSRRTAANEAPAPQVQISASPGADTDSAASQTQEVGSPNLAQASAEQALDFAQALRFARLHAHAVQALGSDEQAEAWLQDALPLLGYRTPAEMCMTEEGAKAADALLTRLEHGVFS